MGSCMDVVSDQPELAPKTVVTTLLLTDLVDSTSLVDRLGDTKAAAIFSQQDRLARDLLKTYGGQEIDKTDGFLMLFAVSPSFYLGLLFLAAVGYGAMVLMTVNNTAIQLIIPNEVRGRVMSVMMMSFGLMPLGAVPAGIAAQALGDVRPVVVVGGALCVATMLVFFATIPSLRSLDRRLEEEQAKADPAGPGGPTGSMGGHPTPGRPPVAAEPASARAD